MARGTAFGYDAVGNRTRRQVSLAGVTETEKYVYDAFSNQYKSSAIKFSFFTLQSRTLSHSDSGNRASDVASGVALNLNYAMTYDATDRLASVSTGATVLGAYVHNALGQRVSKTRATGAVTHYLYDLSGRLIAEADGATGATGAEYVAFEGINLAWITTGSIYWVHGDHLGTPQVLTDDLGAEAWSALYSPFGVVEETGPLDFNLRFPGQYHDRETEYYYNYFRTYDPTSGRYVESDPIGLRGGWNTYGYVGGNPVTRVDPDGLESLLGGGGIGANPDDATLGDIAFAVGVTLGPLAIPLLPEITAAVTAAANACKKITCKFEKHPAHHKFGLPFNRYMKHLQATCWIKGKKGSTFIIRIPY